MRPCLHGLLFQRGVRLRGVGDTRFRTVIFSTPVYWYSIPARIKGVIDCLFSLMMGGKKAAGNKRCGLISCCEEDVMVNDSVRPRRRCIRGWSFLA